MNSVIIDISKPRYSHRKNSVNDRENSFPVLKQLAGPNNTIHTKIALISSNVPLSKTMKINCFQRSSKNRIYKRYFPVKNILSNTKTRKSQMFENVVFKKKTRFLKRARKFKTSAKIPPMIKQCFAGKQKCCLKNRNLWVWGQRKHLTENEVSHSSKASESGIASESKLLFATSQTGNATFGESLFPVHLACVHETAEARLPFCATIPSDLQSVPAADRGTPFSQSSEDGSRWFSDALATADNLTVRVCNCAGLCDSSNPGYSSLNTLPDRIYYLDYDHEDYRCVGCLPKSSQQLIASKSVGSNNSSSVYKLGSCHTMATTEDDPRSVNKISRTPGKNISKLRKLFDSGGSDVCDYEKGLSNCDENSVPSSQTKFIVPSNNNEQPDDFKSDVLNKIKNADVNKSFHSVCNLNLKDVQNEEMEHNLLDNSPQKVSSSSIPYCRKVTSSGDLWKNVDIGVNSSNDGLWSTGGSNNYSSNSQYNPDIMQKPSSFVASTADLNNLIAASRAELSKKKEPVLSDKSTLENYFTSFDNSKPKQIVSIDSDDCSDFEIPSNEIFQSSASSYDCYVDEINFEDEDATLSDTSSDEEIRINAPLSSHYLPAYSLHTIIEESCEESERESRGATPTNEGTASKLERYFSWDIINEREISVKKKDDDESTIFSDSLSEGSGSLNGDVNKEIDPTQLASSRLEKYFTSGLVGNENYFYPDDAEFIEDGPVSDFDEDSVHQKISRSALLSSLENIADTHENNSTEPNEETIVDYSLQNEEKSIVSENDKCDIKIESHELTNEIIDLQNKVPENLEANYLNNNACETKSKNVNSDVYQNSSTECITNIKISSSNQVQLEEKADSSETSLEQKEIIKDEIQHVINEDITAPRQFVNKEQLAHDVHSVIKKLLMYFSDKHDMETDYVSAWHILETEIERLMQSLSSTVQMDNNSCNSSTIGSNNSDYGSDTIESLDCMTDDDESADAKIRAKYPLIDILNASYKIQPDHDLYNFNISEETLSIWKRLIQSLQKDSFCMKDSKICDPNTEARQYIRDQIITLMHTVTIGETKNECELNETLLEKENDTVSLNKDIQQINEAYNISIGHPKILSEPPEDVIILASSPRTLSEDKIILNETSSNVEGLEVVNNNDLIGNETLNCLDNHITKDAVEESVCFELSKDMQDSSSCNSTIASKQNLEKLNVDEVDLKLEHKSKKDSSKSFNVFVDIDLDESKSNTISSKDIVENITDDETVKRSSLQLWVSGESGSISGNIDESSEIADLPNSASCDQISALNDIKHEKSHRDTGYYSFKSEENLLHETPPPDEFMDVPNFKSLKRSIKKFPLSSPLSKSTNNINQAISIPDTKFNTLQSKSSKAKGSNSSSKQFASFFSPSAVFRKLTGSKTPDVQTSEVSYPQKYLKKYARSSSVDSESIIGAISMPHLNTPKPGDSYSALGLYSENDKDSSVILDDEDIKPYSAYSRSVLSLGSHSASMTSVYSAAGCNYGYVTVSGDILFGLNYNQKSQMMEVFVKQCRNLAAADAKRNRSDPYVKVYLLPDKTKGGKRKTKTKKNTLSPVFNELLRFPVLKHELESRTLWLSVWNSDLFGRNDFLGEVMLPLGYRLLDSPTLRWYPLQERMEALTSPLNYKGELFLALKYVPRDLSLESRFRPAHVISLRGALHILVKEARNISTNGGGGNLDAFCKSYLLPDKSKSSKQKTPVVRRSRHPKWYYTVIYEDMSLEELKERSLELTVWDHDKLTSNEFMGGIRLNLGSGLYHGVPVDWMDARRDEAALWQAMLDSPNMWVDGCLSLRPTMQFHHG